MVADAKGPRVLLVGERFAALAEQALPGGSFEVSGGDRLIDPAALHAGFDLVLLDADAADPLQVAEAIEALSRRANAPAALLIGAHLPAGLVRALMKLKRSDVLEVPFTAGDLARAASGLLESAQAVGAAPHVSHCWTVTGAVGGAGATTIAVELATHLADRKKGQRVALVDLNLADGAACAYLGASANMMLGDASISPDRIDAALLDAFAVKVDGCLDLFASPRDPLGFEAVSPEAVCRLLEVVCDVYDWVIVDLPRLRQPWTLDVLSGSDEVMVVSELTVPALLAARALTLEIESVLPGDRTPRVVVNRLASRVFGPAPSVAEAEKALQRKVTAGITSDWEAAACSVNLGGAIGHHRPRSKIVKDIAALAERLAAHARRDDHSNLRIAG